MERGRLQSRLCGVSLLLSKEKFVSQKILSFSQKAISEMEIYFWWFFHLINSSDLVVRKSGFNSQARYGLPVYLATHLCKMMWWYQVCWWLLSWKWAGCCIDVLLCGSSGWSAQIFLISTWPLFFKIFQNVANQAPTVGLPRYLYCSKCKKMPHGIISIPLF